MDAVASTEIRSIIDAALRGEMTGALAARVYDLGREATLAVMLAAGSRIAELRCQPAAGPHTPSGALPVYTKAAAPKHRRGTPGARAGHEGFRRAAPKIDRTDEVEALRTCPDCHNPVLPARKRLRRVVEDMPAQTTIEAIEYVIPQHWCPRRGGSSRAWARRCPTPRSATGLWR